jgi:hypothetical protein
MTALASPATVFARRSSEWQIHTIGLLRAEGIDTEMFEHSELSSDIRLVAVIPGKSDAEEGSHRWCRVLRLEQSHWPRYDSATTQSHTRCLAIVKESS